MIEKLILNLCQTEPSADRSPAGLIEPSADGSPTDLMKATPDKALG